MCLHCGAHFVWVDSDAPSSGEHSQAVRERG
jgi:hypothetical protein